MSARISQSKQKPEAIFVQIADYALNYQVKSASALATARACLMDALGCGLESLSYPACTKLLGPIVPGTMVPNGAKVPGTSFQLDPVHAAFNIGTMIRWLDFNDTWLAAEWGHPSDNLAGILATADWLSRTAIANGNKPLTMHDVLCAMVKAHEIQGIMALNNSFNRVGLDHVVLVKLASTAVCGALLGLTRDELVNAISHVFIDGSPLRTYRHAPNTGSRKSWAAGDASSRGVRLAMIAKTGEMGYPTALSAPGWGFYDVAFKQGKFSLARPLGTYVMENVLFKISFPAEFHAQTAVEAGLIAHKKMAVLGKSCKDIRQVVIRTHESAIRIIDKNGPLNNPADRDHCLQYMLAIALLYGRLTANDYEDEIAQAPEIDQLRATMRCVEEKTFTRDYLAADKRSIANAVRIEFKDGTYLDEICIEYPLGHKRRRKEGLPVLQQKFKTNLARRYASKQQNEILNVSLSASRLDKMPVNHYVDLYQLG